MPAVLHIPDGSPWPNGYSGREVSGLMPGASVEVSDGTAAYLTGEWPAHFRLVPVPVAAPVTVTESKPRGKR